MRLEMGWRVCVSEDTDYGASSRWLCLSFRSVVIRWARFDALTFLFVWVDGLMDEWISECADLDTC